MGSARKSGHKAPSTVWQWKDKRQWLDMAYKEVLRSVSVVWDMERDGEGPEERLVVVYGTTQSGKTALILQLAGVAEEHMKRVYGLIRGGAKPGRSSTSHAFLYQRSEDDCFHLWTQAGVAAERKNSARLEQEEDVPRCIDGLREQMNRGEGLTDVIYLAIPRKYCRKDDEDYRLNLLDMPGIGSKDRLEQPQVARLLEQYARLAAATVVVCSLYQIQSMSSLRVPADEDYWWENQEKVLVVLTYAYSTLGDREERELWAGCDRPEELYRRMINLCRDKLTPVYHEWQGGGGSGEMPLEVFPVDLDESLRKYGERITPEQRVLLTGTQERILAELRESVARRKNGDCFPLFIQSLHSRVEINQRWRRKKLEAEHRRLTGKLKESANQLEVFQALLPRRGEELDELRANLEAFSCARLDRTCCAETVKECGETVNELGSAFWKVLPLGERGTVTSEVQKCAEKLRGELISSWEEMAAQVREWTWVERARVVDELETPWSVLKEHAEQLADECCQRVQEKVQSDIWTDIKVCRTWVEESCKELLDGLVQAEKTYMNQVQGLSRRREKALASELEQLEQLKTGVEQEIIRLQKNLSELEQTQRREEIQAQADRELLDNTKSIARRHYLIQRDQVIRALKAEKKPGKRINLLLLLAGMEQDYNNDINI